MMDMMINAAKRNLEILTDLQKKNEEMVKVMLDHGSKTREQMVATNEALLNIATAQSAAATKFVEESVKATREIMEQQVAEAQKMMAAQR